MILALNDTVTATCDVPSCMRDDSAPCLAGERDAATAQGHALAELTARGWRFETNAGRGGVLDLCPACAQAGA